MELNILEFGYKSLQNVVHIKTIALITILQNICCIIFGIFYLVLPIYISAWDAFGIILPITLFVNLFHIYLSSKQAKKSSIANSRLYTFCSILLIYYMISIFSIMGGNLLLSVATVNDGVIIGLGYFLIHFFYFSLMILNVVLGMINLKLFKSGILYFLGDTNQKSYSSKYQLFRRLSKKPLNIISSIIFLLSIVFAIVIVFGSFEVITTFIAIIAGQFGIFFSLIFLANLLLKLNLKRKMWSKSKRKKRAFLGLLISGILMLPLVFRNFSLFCGERTFVEIFGADWRNNISADVETYFLATPYTTPGYILGNKPKDCLTELNIKYYEDGDFSLYFDVYMPLDNGISLPGENSTLIRIHGGAWVSGDKGTFNNVQVNRYFAAQGYIVFDIQYGLHSLFSSGTAENYNIDDMVNHIAIFTSFLANNSKKYGANLNSVFISGGSSGGHLSSVVALATANGEYPSIFHNNLTIKGFIPLYPANGMENFFGIDGNEAFIHPEQLIRSNSPPCLIYQGTHDILNYFNIANNFLKAYQLMGNYNCSILWFPLAGHGSDFYFSGYYNQIFLYYMERFMYFFH